MSTSAVAPNQPTVPTKEVTSFPEKTKNLMTRVGEVALNTLSFIARVVTYPVRALYNWIITKKEGIQGFTALMKKLGESTLHQKARSNENNNNRYPERAAVSDEQVSWKTKVENYNPIEFTHKNVLRNDETLKTGHKWAHPPKGDGKNQMNAARFKQLQKDMVTFEKVSYDKEGVPLNPHGRTGMKGRGLLGKWGANQAADPIVPQIDENGVLHFVLIQREDSGIWAIPGGMVDAQEGVSRTLKRELGEEALVKDENGVPKDTSFDLDHPTWVYRGYVDDPRNTDNSWMETSVAILLQKKGALKGLEAGDDAVGAEWVSVSDERVLNLYASHSPFIKLALERMDAMGALKEVNADCRKAIDNLLKPKAE